MNKTKAKKPLLIVLIILAAIVLLIFLAVFAAGIMFRNEIKIISSMKQIDGINNAYYMEVDGYCDDDIFATNISSDSELAGILAEKISKGFYKSAPTEKNTVSCSMLSGVDSNGNHIWCRNFDWSDTPVIVLKSSPKDAYSSISTVAFSNISDSVSLDNIAGEMVAIGAYYVPMDGINEKGLCVADLEVNEGGMIDPNTEKPDITVTMAIRLLLNKAATVDEAVALLKEYDIHPSGSISHHITISDSIGKSVVVEFVDMKMIVTETTCVTNFCIANGDSNAGGESAKNRYEILNSIMESNDDVIDEKIAFDAMKAVSQNSGKWVTKWTIVYSDNTATYYFDRNFDTPYEFSNNK